MKVYHHVVLFRLHNEVDQTSQDEAVEALRSLGKGIPGLVSWSVNSSIDTRKGRIIIEEAVFQSRSDFEAFRDSLAHAEISKVMSQIADWWVGDYEA